MAPLKFEWDSGNLKKSIDKHLIGNEEGESIFLDPKKLVVLSQRLAEVRYLCIGISNKGRVLTSYFIVRNGKIRIIGTRVARKTERKKYESGANQVCDT